MSATRDRRADPGPARVKAWDLPTRIFHWSLAALVFGAWASWRYAEPLGDYVLRYHRLIGYAVLVLLVWRAIWGFVGSSTSRFGAFVRAPRQAGRYALDVACGRDRRFLGHNPLGGWMVLVLLTIVGAETVLGLFTPEENGLAAGPLNRLVSESTGEEVARWHSWLFYWVILALVALHIAASSFYTFVKKEELIGAMLTGTKPAGTFEDAVEADIVARPMLRAAFCLALASIIVFAPLLAFGGRL